MSWFRKIFSSLYPEPQKNPVVLDEFICDTLSQLISDVKYESTFVLTDNEIIDKIHNLLDGFRPLINKKKKESQKVIPKVLTPHKKLIKVPLV